jgi:hypothetical protein
MNEEGGIGIKSVPIDALKMHWTISKKGGGSGEWYKEKDIKQEVISQMKKTY